MARPERPSRGPFRRGDYCIDILILCVVAALGANYHFQPFVDSTPYPPRSQAKLDLETLRSALMLYEAQNECYRLSNQAALKGRYLERILEDPWGRPYLVDPRLRRIGTLGRDGVAGGMFDDEDLFLQLSPPRLRPST